MNIFNKIKNKLYQALVNSNENVRLDYQSFVEMDLERHRKHRLRSWMYLLKLNIKYRIFKKKPNEEDKMIPENKIVPENKVPRSKTSANPTPNPPNSAPKREIKTSSNAYLGTESTIENRTPPQHFIKKLLEYDVISFDIFDTLIFRPVSNPKDVFKILGEQHNMLEFDSIRVRSEAEAREIRYEKYGDFEVTLQEIYERVEFYTGIPATYGKRLELELEQKLLFPNPYMKRVFDMLKESGRRIIAISDMYISSDILEKWLKDLGYDGFEHIYVSCDYKCSKKDGALFKYVKQNLSFNRIMHIDDSWNAILIARSLHWACTHYKNVNALGNKYRTKGMSSLIGSAYAGVVNSHLYNGLEKYSPLYEYGYTYGGLFILGYCSWIHTYCKQNNIDKILFMSRDGYILKKVYDSMYDDIPSSYFYFSRILSSRISIRSYPFLFIQSFILRKCESNSLPISYYLDLLDLHTISGDLWQYGLSPFDIVEGNQSSVTRRFVKFIVDHKEQIAALYCDEIEAAKKYIIFQINGKKRVACVDIGWRGSSALALQRFITYECKSDCKVFGLMAASPYDVNISQMQSGVMSAYMFSTSFNLNVLNRHERFKADNAIYEFFLTAPHGTIKRFYLKNDNSIGFEFEVPDTENNPFIKEIQKGILDFANEYYRHWKFLPYMLDIPGSDAAVNIQNITVQKDYIKKLFSDFRYNMGVGGKTVSFSEIIK